MCAQLTRPSSSRLLWAGEAWCLNWKMEKDEAYRCVPLSGEALAARVQVQIQVGPVDLIRLIKQATVRRHVAVQSIRANRDAGHPDYQDAFRGKAFYRRLHDLSPTTEARLELCVSIVHYLVLYAPCCPHIQIQCLALTLSLYMLMFCCSQVTVSNARLAV